MSQLGLGAMIHMLGGGSENKPDQYYGKKIVSVAIDHECEPEEFQIEFEDGVRIAIIDNGQSCCESRYMRTDDNIEDIVGGVLKEIKVKELQDNEGEYDAHEIAFLEIATDKGSIVFSTHNEHNGYYGGFGLSIVERGAK